MRKWLKVFLFSGRLLSPSLAQTATASAASAAADDRHRQLHLYQWCLRPGSDNVGLLRRRRHLLSRATGPTPYT